MKEFLSAKGIAFTNKDVSSDKAARDEIVAKYGRMATPLLAIGQRFFLGFTQNRKEIENIIDELAGRRSD